MACACLFTTPFLIWEIEYFRNPGTTFYRIELVFAAAFLASLPLYHRLRQYRLWRWELAGLLSIPVAAAGFYQPRATVVATGLAFCAFTLGRALLAKCAVMPERALEQMVVSSAAGFGLLCPVLLGIGVLHGYYPSVFLALLILPALLFWRHMIAFPPLVVDIHRNWSSAEELRTPLGTVLVAFAALFLTTASIVALAPSIAFDVLRYHLPEAQTYAARHGLAVLPFLSMSLMPQNTETLMTLAFSLGGQAAAQIISPMFFLLSVVAVFALARRFGASALGALAAVVLAGSIPFIHWSGSVAKNDLPLAFFELAALLAFFLWHETAKFRWIGVGALFVGTSLGTKYTVVFALLPLAVLYGFAVWKQARRMRALALILLIVAASGLLWQVRAFALTGSPLYPLHIGGAFSTTSSAHSLRSGLFRLVLLPWKIQFAGGPFFESPLQVPLGFAFLLFFPAWFLVRRRSSTFAEKCALGFSIAYLIYWWVSVPALRYAIAPAFLLMASIATRLTAWYESAAPLAKSCALAACSYALWFALCGAQIIEINGPQFRFFTRQTDSAQYLGEALATFPALHYLKKEAGPASSVFGVMNCSAAYAPDPALFDCAYNAAETRNLEAKLRRFDFQYVILPSGNSAEPIFLSVFDRISGSPLFEDANFRVYRLHATNQNAFTREGAR